MAFSGSGSGTEASPYQITTWAQLQEVNSFHAAYFKLMNDLSSSTTGYSTYASSTANSGSGWLPLGDGTTQFTGSFDGDGHTISDLYIDRNSTNYIGLFGYIDGGEIKDVGVVDCDITGNHYVGGLIGTSSSSTITNSYSTGSVSGGNSVGGLVGYISYSSTVTNSYSTGSVRGNYYVGGLVGHNYKSFVTNSYSTGSVSGSSSVGGLVGRSYSSTVTNSFWDTTTSGTTSSAGGTGKTTAQMQTLSTFSSYWNIVDIDDYDDEVWKIDDGNDYPKLGWEIIATGTNMKINIGDTWKTVKAMKINIDDIWKNVKAVKQNIGGTWKTVF